MEFRRLFLKIAVLADPHGNILALKEVLNEIARLRIEKIIIAGDLVGYGPNPKEVIDTVRHLDAYVIKGNHDDSVVRRDYSWMNEMAASAAEWTASILDEDSIAYLSSLKFEMMVEIEAKKIGIYHGSPKDPFEYITSNERARALLRRSPVDIVICGHTHIPMWVVEDEKIFLNPGGVGQPRDGINKASFAILDPANPKEEIHRVRYDIHSVQEKMIDVGLPHFLADRLSQGI